jgi:adenylate cyclase
VRAYGLSAATVGAASSGARAAAAPKAHRTRWLAGGVALVAALSIAGGLAWRVGVADRPVSASAVDKLATAPKLSLVVLPFSNLSGDPEQEYFADGLTEDLTTDLSHLDGSFVIARNTAFTYKGKGVDAKQIGRELGVRYVLEGSVRRIGESVTINAQLISTESGAHVWADRFEGERAKLGQSQVEFVSRLANSLGVELVNAEALRSIRERPTNPDAADFLLRGLAAYYLPQTDAARKAAQENFERALQLDPKIVPALANRSLLLFGRVVSFTSENPAADQERAEALASQAINTQPQNALGHLARAWALFGRVFVGKPDDWESAIYEFNTAIAADRNLAGAYAGAGFFEVFLGRAAERIASAQVAMRLSPHDPDFASWQFWICHLQAHLAEWDQAIEWCRKSLVTNPAADNFWARLDLASALAWSGRADEAKREVAEILKINPNFTLQTYTAIKWTHNSTFNEQIARMGEGLRKAGLPEGKKTD